MYCDKILEEIETHQLLAIRFEQMDMNGIARSKLIPSCHFKEKATEGLVFPLGSFARGVQGESVPGTDYHGVEGHQDALMVPDFDTFCVLPWVERTGRILIEPTFKAEFVSAHPRVLARRQLDKLRELGLSLLSAHEYEFHLLDKETLRPHNNDINIHSTIRRTPVDGFLNSIMEHLPKVGINVECLEDEMGPGELEITYKPTLGIRSPDNAHTYKTSVKEIAQNHGYLATFMSRPWDPIRISACHFCHSLWDVEGKVPLTYDSNDPQNLSDISRHWIAGLLMHAAAIKILMAPTVNCLKGPADFVPVNATWGMDNRSCAIRVKINGGKGTYIENRLGLSAGNPYITLAATVAAGIDGINNKLPLPKECTGNAFRVSNVPPQTATLPQNTQDALKALHNDELIVKALGEDFIKCFSAIRMNEATVEREAREMGLENWDFDYFHHYL